MVRELVCNFLNFPPIFFSRSSLSHPKVKLKFQPEANSHLAFFFYSDGGHRRGIFGGGDGGGNLGAPVPVVSLVCTSQGYTPNLCTLGGVYGCHKRWEEGRRRGVLRAGTPLKRGACTRGGGGVPCSTFFFDYRVSYFPPPACSLQISIPVIIPSDVCFFPPLGIVQVRGW